MEDSICTWKSTDASTVFCGTIYGIVEYLLCNKRSYGIVDNLTEEQKKVITGTSQICTMNNQPIHLIEGDAINFKITTDSDLLIVRTLLGGK